MRIRLNVILLSLMAANLGAAEPPAFDHAHARLTLVLKRFVKEARVNYQGLKADRQGLNAYLGLTSAVTRKSFDGWNEQQQLAFLINVYNARTLELITDEYPIKSIKKIGWLPGAAWRRKFIPFFGSKVSLGYIEHEILRKNYSVPEIHFALVCAAKGCPPLRSTAYTGRGLRKELDSQGKLFLGNTAKNRVDSNNQLLYLSPIFDWFEEDFEKSAGSVIGFVRRYLPERTRSELGNEFRIVYTKYDWSLNEAP